MTFTYLYILPQVCNKKGSFKKKWMRAYSSAIYDPCICASAAFASESASASATII